MIFKQAQVDKYLKKSDKEIKGFVVYGTNEGLVAEYVKNLTKSIAPDIFDPFQVVYVNEIEEGLIAGEYNAQSLMGGRRVIVIRDADNNLTKILKNIFEDSKSDTLIIASSLTLNKNSSLVKLANDREDMALVACYEDRDEDIYSTARAIFIENNITINNESLQLLCSRLSNDRKSNIGEIDKLITYIGDKKNITVEDVHAAVSDTSSTNSDDVNFFTAAGVVDKSQSAFTKLVNEGVEPVSVVRSLSYHFKKILDCKAIMEQGETLEKAMYKLTPRVIFFREASFKKQVAIWPKDKLFGVLELLYKCEKDCKTTGIPVEEVVSYTLLQIATAARKLSL